MYIEIYLNFSQKKTTQPANLQLRQITVGIQKSQPVVGMRISLQKMDVWFQ